MSRGRSHGRDDRSRRGERRHDRARGTGCCGRPGIDVRPRRQRALDAARPGLGDPAPDPHGPRAPADPPLDTLTRYAGELDEIAEAALSLDQREHELEHQLRWWAERIAELETQLTGDSADDIEIGRELALFRGRISGAHAMQRHYTQERAALADRHDRADAACAAELAAR